MRYKGDSFTSKELGIWGFSDRRTKDSDRFSYELVSEVEAGFRVYDVMDRDVHYTVQPGNILHYRLTWHGEQKPRFALIVDEKITRIDRKGDGEIAGTLLVEQKAPDNGSKSWISIYIDLPPASWRLAMRDELPGR